MKNKVVTSIVLFVLILTSFSNLCKVKAYTGEIDPKGYITLPMLITIKDGVATGTISLSSSATGYTLSYQKVDITKSTMDSISAKHTAVNDYIKTSNAEIETKTKELTKLQTDYKNLLQTEPENTEAIETAKKAYEDAASAYKTYYEGVEAEIKKLEDEYYALIPNYTNSWTETTNATGNVSLDFKTYTGTVCFVLWAKATNGTDTYYDFNVYSSEIKSSTSTGGDTSGAFSKAKFELKKDGVSGAILEISGASVDESESYYVMLTNDSKKPDVSNLKDEDRLYLDYDKTSKKLKATVTEYVEVNKDLYANVLEKKDGKYNVVASGIKLKRYDEPKYADAFSDLSFVTYSGTQIVTNFTHSSDYNRKMQIKIGKITDKSILQKIKNKDSSGFADLLSYAKENSGMYNKTVDADNSSILESTKSIDLKNLQHNEYYYLYVKADSENGKYIPAEAVTLAQAHAYADSDSWFLFFYGKDEFEWADFGGVTGENTPTKGKDNTIAGGNLPNTGVNACIVAIITVTLITGGFVAYKKYKEYNF